MPLPWEFHQVVTDAISDNAPNKLSGLSKSIVSVADFQNGRRPLCPGFREKTMENSHGALVPTVSGVIVMCRNCVQSLRMRERRTLSGPLKHHLVMDTAKVFSHKPGRGIGLYRWFGLCSRALKIWSRDS